jgi:prepilin-type processing-associated H-X9-DG protein/prepilin-type N-terminal cleavage/methylation domain-containing protein
MKQKTAFTLMELLVVISVVSLLMGILMPVLTKAKQQGQSIVCLNNLRQMCMAATVYSQTYNEYYPPASFTETVDGVYFIREWDFIRLFEGSELKQCEPGMLWQGDSVPKIQQCPSFNGNANSLGDPYTGYNYNASYIGGIMTRNSRGELSGVNSNRAIEVRRPSRCAIFGDGQYADGANKFMRAPFTGKLDADYAMLRPYGTQGYRHLNRTNVAYCDGHSATVGERYTETYTPLKQLIAEGTGFLSLDNSAYGLE